MGNRVSATPSSLNPRSSYDPAYFSRLFQIEDRHFWFRARDRVIATMVHQVVNELAPGYRVLEAGCGTGNILRVLENVCSGGTVVGMDLFNEGLQYARLRASCSVVQADLNAPAFGVQFDLIGIFDVLEHLPDDLKVLHDLRDLLKPSGALLLTVPAHPGLWSYFDDASHHCRRYEEEELTSKLTSAGFRVEYVSQYMMSIFPLVWLRRLVSLSRRRSLDADLINRMALRELHITPVINGALDLLLKSEASVIARRRRLPFGASLIALARKDAEVTA